MARNFFPSSDSSWFSLLIWMLCPVLYLILVLVFMPILILPAAICLGVGLIGCFLGLLLRNFAVGLGVLWLAAFVIFIWMFCV